MGVVYEAEDTMLGRRAAQSIKKILLRISLVGRSVRSAFEERSTSR
jgi:hypothetical protein